MSRFYLAILRHFISCQLGISLYPIYSGQVWIQQSQQMTCLSPENDQPAFDIVHTDSSFHVSQHPSLLKEDPSICNKNAVK